MTEDEARKKWCPMVRIIEYHADDNNCTHPAAGNRSCYEWLSSSCCIASDCMMWRWTVPDATTSGEYEHGYCGLAK